MGYKLPTETNQEGSKSKRVTWMETYEWNEGASMQHNSVFPKPMVSLLYVDETLDYNIWAVSNFPT
jgi:hypothetical protein